LFFLLIKINEFASLFIRHRMQICFVGFIVFCLVLVEF
jgi:hypothetical protein